MFLNRAGKPEIAVSPRDLFLCFFGGALFGGRVVD